MLHGAFVRARTTAAATARGGANVRTTLPEGPVATGVLALATVLLLAVSPMLLAAVGINYEDAGGSPLEKLHPATLVAFALLAWQVAASGQPVSWTIAVVERHPGLLFYVLAVLCLMAYSSLVLRLPFTGPIDTFLHPAALFLLLAGASERRRWWLAAAMHGMMLLNATLGIGEYLAGERLIPYTAGGVPVLDDWRSTALLGHPLTNASVTAAYLLCLAYGAARALPSPVVLVLATVNAAALAPFGGRSSTLLMIAFLIVLGLWRLVPYLRGRPIERRRLALVLAALPLAVGAVAGLVALDFFDRFLDRFVDDGGSAESRLIMFELFRDLGAYEILFGPDPNHISTRQRVLGIEFGIESFWVGFILYYGLIVSIPIFIALFTISAEVVRATRPAAAWILLFFFLVASTSASLTAKGSALAIVVLQALVLLGPERRNVPIEPGSVAGTMRRTPVKHEADGGRIAGEAVPRPVAWR
jgi:hypothetical protein